MQCHLHTYSILVVWECPRTLRAGSPLGSINGGDKCDEDKCVCARAYVRACVQMSQTEKILLERALAAAQEREEAQAAAERAFAAAQEREAAAAAAAAAAVAAPGHSASCAEPRQTCTVS